MKQPFSGSFSECVRFELAFRMKNRALAAKLGLTTDASAVELWVDEQNAIRCIAAGSLKFVVLDNVRVEDYQDPSKKNIAGSVAAIARIAKAGAVAWSSMFGAAGVVSRDIAESRAAICAVCPQNDVAGGILNYLVKSAADSVLALVGTLKDMDVSTSKDDQLGMCQACYCPMKLKVHVDTNVILQHLGQETWVKLQKENPVCWIRAEAKEA